MPAVHLVAGLLLLASCVCAQSVSGRVVDSASGRPAAGVNLTLSPSDGGTRSTATSDAEGRFRFDAVKFGRYTLLASKAGYARMSYGANGVGNPGHVLTVASERGISDLEVRIIPLSAIQGNVIDRNRDPVAGVAIACGVVDLYGASPTMEPVSVVTDARGEYRIPNMPPGRYYVQAIPVLPGANLPAYYPSAGAFGEAQAVLVAPGQEAAGITITLRQRPVFSVKGKFAGGTPSGLQLLLLPKSEEGGPQFGKSYRELISRHIVVTRNADPDGSFELVGVERGVYVLDAMATTPRGQESIGRTTVVVTDRDVENVLLPVGRFVQLSLRIRPDREVKDASCFLNAYPVGGDPMMLAIMGSTGAGGVFTDHRAAAGVYALNARCKPDGWVVQSIRSDGVDQQDALDAGINLTDSTPVTVVNLTLTADTGVVSATVKDDDKPAPGRWVTLIPDPPRPGKAVLERSGWTGEDGTLLLRHVVPGDYRLYAWREASMGASSVNPFFLNRYASQAVKVTVRAGNATQVETRTIQP